MINKSILILNSFLKEFTGSEIVTLELAEFFVEKGAKVTVAGFCINKPLMNYFNHENITLVNLYNLDEDYHYDLIWAHHFTTIEYCIFEKNISADKVIFSSLSHFTNLETPPLILDRITHLLVNSIENRNTLIELGFNENNIHLFQNPAPKKFFEQKYQLRDKLKRIAIVSNHIPDEMLEAIHILKAEAIAVSIYGKGFEEVRITENILSKYDAVITIGKTVQYCLAMGIPVYCYDMFGGVGWITRDKIKEASDFNFSGRNFPIRKTALDICREIKEYKRENFTFYKEISYLYNLEKVVNNIIHAKNKGVYFNNKLILALRRKQQKVYSERLFNHVFCQLYFSIDNSFKEEKSIKHNLVLDSYNKIIFELDGNYKEFRLDLSNSPAVINNLEIICCLENGAKRSLSLDECELKQIDLIDGNLNIFGVDPQVYFQSKDIIENIEVSFFIDVSVALGDYLSYRNSKIKILEEIKNKLELELHFNENSLQALTEENKRLDDKLSFNKSKVLELIKEKDNIESECHFNRNRLLTLMEEKNQLEIIVNINKQKNLFLENRIEDIQKVNDELSIKNISLNHELLGVKNSRSYKIMNKLHKVKNIILFRKDDYELIKHSDLFDIEYYINVNNDVKEQAIDPIQHYMDYGWREGRNPSSSFDTVFYLNSYPDVKESGINPLVHYLKYGRKEGRNISTSNGSINSSKLYIIKDIYKLVRINPDLIRKFIFVTRQNGLSYAILKMKNKMHKLKNSDLNSFVDSKPNISNILKCIDKNNINIIHEFYGDNRCIKPIDILIPIYNGFEFLDNLFNSIVSNTSLPYRLIIGNDKSPDKRVKLFIEEFIRNNPKIDIIFIENKENLGFLKTVNLLASYANNHLVILNTDTEVPEYWLERLMYPIFSNKDIASTTPFTNSGTICSFPEYLVDNCNLYKDLSLKQIDLLFSWINVDGMISVPTGVGFCMGMNFDVIKKIGMFDEIYGKGYGEENDWCQRAIQSGFRNVHIPNLFVYHKHGGSFLSEDKKRYINEHYQILLSKFPSYDAQIQNTIRENKLESLRKFMKVLIDFKYNHQGNILVVDHALGGGANAYRDKEISKYKEQGKNVLLFTYNINLNEYFAEFHTQDYSETFKVEQEKDLFKIVELLEIESLLLNGLVSFPNVIGFVDLIRKLKEKFSAIRLVFPVHDYFCISPNYTLLGNSGKYEGVPVEHNIHSDFLKSSKAEFKLFCNEVNAELWQNSWRGLLGSCDDILCFSHSSEKIMLTAYPELTGKLTYKPHNIKGTFNEIYDESLAKNSKVIGILGNINLAKGRDVIKELISHIEKHNYNVKVVLIGNLDADICSECFVKTGSYKVSDVPALVRKYNVTEFLIPSVWPETFSYTTDEIMQLGYPLSVFDLGAPAERVRNYARGRVLPLEGYLEILCK